MNSIKKGKKKDNLKGHLFQIAFCADSMKFYQNFKDSERYLAIPIKAAPNLLYIQV